MYNFKKKLVCLTSAVALAASGINVPSMQVASYAEEAVKPIVPEKAKGWTFGLYLCGQDLEEYNNNASSDLIEILKADVPEGFSKDNNIIVEFGGCYAWHFQQQYAKYLKEEKKLSRKEIGQIIPLEIDESVISQYKVNFEFEYKADDGTTKTIPTIEYIKDVAEYDTSYDNDYDEDEYDEDYDESDEFLRYLHKEDEETDSNDDNQNDETKEESKEYADMGDEKFLREFINDLDTEYPAEHMAIDLWNHGGGITDGVCFDEYTDDGITLEELKNVLRDRQEAGFDKIDLLGYDACLMSNYESWYNIAPYVKVGVGSMTSEPAFGWNYTPFIEELGANYANEEFTAKELGSSIVNAYKSFYEKDGENYNAILEEAAEEEGMDVEELKPELDEFFGSAVLCAVDLDKIVLSSVKFTALSDDLFKAYIDPEGIKTIFDTSIENGTIEEGYDIVSFSKFLDAISEVAPTRAESLKDYDNTYLKLAFDAYDNIDEKVEAVKTSVNDSLINSYNGYEDFALYDSLGMSIFVPSNSMSEVIAMFNANTYPTYAVSDAYARLTYLYASGVELIDDVADREYNPLYKYDATNGILSLSLDEENAYYADAMSAYSFAETNGKTYLVDEQSVNPTWDETNVLSIKPEVGFYSVDGKTPISANSTGDFEDGINCQELSVYGYLNDTYGMYIFANDSKTGDIYFVEFTAWDDEDDYDDDDYMLAKKQFENRVLKERKARLAAKNSEEDLDDDYDEFVDDDYYDDEDNYRNELKPGDRVKFEASVVNEVSFSNGGEDRVVEYSDEYVIKESDRREFTHQTTADYTIIAKRYTPNIKFVKVDSDKYNVAMGYEVLPFNDSDDDYYFFDDFFGRKNSKNVDDSDDVIDENVDDNVIDENIDDEEIDENVDDETEDDETEDDSAIVDYKIINIGKVKAFADSKISVEKKEYELTGEAIEPKVTFEGEGAKLVAGKDYDVTYEDNIGIGTAKAVIVPLGDLDFLDVREAEFNISKVKSAVKEKIVYVTEIVKQPKQVKIKSVKNNKKKSFKIKWKKVKGAKGYQVKYALNKKFTKGKKVKNTKKLSLTVKKLKKKTYFVKVRAYTLTKDGKKVYGSWSKIKKVKIKK